MATPYSFTQPIRYYKANDPYYYEVDNIPLRQLEENILYVKERIEGKGSGGGGGGGDGTTPGSFLTTTSELNINNIRQLKPKCSGKDRQVTVNAGLFTSRVNDAYGIEKPLGKLLFNGPPPSSINLIPALKQIWGSTERDSVWNAFIESTAAAGACPYNINGLAYTYTFHSSPGGLGGNWGVNPSPQTGEGEGKENYPHYEGTTNTTNSTWPGVSLGPLTPSQLGQLIDRNRTYTISLLPTIHLAFVQMWRGVFRTAVVDFPQSTIGIDGWSDDDFYYYDDDNNKIQLTDATQRIDLLVAYTMPIDSVSGALQDYSETFCEAGGTPSPKIIQQPVLGIIKGAGVGIRKNDSSVPPSIDTTEGCPPDPGIPGSKRLLANQNDGDITANYGITDINGNKVHGSFPSPDDLLNMAPLLALDVSSDNFQLVGQTALPLAYIVVKKASPLISESDIIDIRPFLRTTEFTYNERAGVAGANPPLSLANPAVGLYQLQDSVTQLDNKITSVKSPSESGKALYTDYVMGGIAYGVEGTMLTMNEQAGEPEDPWGVQTTGQTYKDPGVGGISYSFSSLTSSKAFLDLQDENLRKAFLQYVFTNRQAHLKRWISDPNSPYSLNTGTYLGLPGTATGGRNIPLYPEWDMPLDGTNYLTVMEGPGGSIKSPKPTWWMWFEGVDVTRPLSYVPGAVVSPNDNKDESSHLSKNYQFGFGVNYGVGCVTTVTKELEITFPSWVNDYDVLVEYINCGPVTSTTDSEDFHINNGFGSGLYLNKGPVVSISGKKKAVFRINSSSNARPGSELGHGGMIVGQSSKPNPGRIADEGGPKYNIADPKGRTGALTDQYAYQWLSYTVCLPQFKQTKYGMNSQGQTPRTVTRYAPKFGAAYYPTVKFTVIGYESIPSDSNTAYNAANNWTLIQNTTVGDPNNLIAHKAPLQTDPGGYAAASKINIENS